MLAEHFYRNPSKPTLTKNIFRPVSQLLLIHDARLYSGLCEELPPWFFSVCFIEYLMVDMNQKRRTQFSGWRTVVSSPGSPWGTESRTHPCSGALPDEYSNLVPPSNSPGPDGLCALCLDTPEKKAKVVSGLDHKPKLKKLSRKVCQCSASSLVILQWIS